MVKAKQDRTGAVPRVQCRHCGNVQDFPEFDKVIIYVCDNCGEPVKVEEPVQ